MRAQGEEEDKGIIWVSEGAGRERELKNKAMVRVL